jgi:ketosteroid isomerase-like protein
MSLRTAGVTLAVAALAAACQPAPAGLTPADEAAIRASVDSFAVRALRADWDGNVALFTANGSMLPPNEPARNGHDAILAWMKAYPPITAFTTGVDEVGGAGDVAYVRGHYAITIMPPGATAAIADTGKFLSVHRRQADDTWPMTLDMFNSDKPAM